MPRPGIETALESAPYDPRLARRMLAYLKPYVGWIALATALALTVTGVTLGFYMLGKRAIDALEVVDLEDAAAVAAGKSELNRLALWMVGLALVLAVCQYFQTWLVQLVGQRAMYRLRSDIFGRLQKLSLAFFDRNPVGRLMTRVTNDVETLQQLLSIGIVTVAADIFMLVGIVGMMFYMHWRMAGVLLLVVGPTIVLVTNLFRVYARRAFRATRKRLADLNSFLQENISGMRVIQVFCREAWNLSRFRELNDLYRRANHLTIYCFASFFALVEMLGNLAAALILWYGGGEALRESITLGGLWLFIQLTERAFHPIRDLSEKFNMFQSAMAASERIFHLMDERPDLEARPGARPAPERVETIELDDVWFAYKEDEWVLRGVSFTVRRGQTIALVGATGAGKTTIGSLLLRFYDVQRGAIRINDVDLREYEPRSLRRKMAIVLQDVFLFNDSIGANITLGDPDIDHEQMVRAARITHVDHFAEAFAESYDHPVSERGATLSVGQKQLLAFARALAFDPEVLLLDEATASVDTATERLIQDALERLFENRTSLVIAHRLSTIQRADEILVLSHGQIVERGDHQGLLAQNGAYRRLYELQYKEDLALAE